MPILLKTALVVMVTIGAGGCGTPPLAAATKPSASSPAAPAARAAPASLQRYEYVQVLMGVQVRLVVYAADEKAAEEAARAAFARIAELENVMSDYQQDSELMRLCARAGEGPVKVSKDLFDVLAYAQRVSRASSGAFDVTVGPVVQLWRQARRSKKLPEPAALAAARAKVGYEKMKLDPQQRTVELSVPGMRLDLGGIGKGYAGDEAIRVLREHGIESALYEAGGDIVLSAPPPDKEGWEIETLDGRPLMLSSAAVSTSGDTEQFVDIDGVRYSHIVDPRTGIGLTNQFAATVVAPRGITSDALATTLTVLGPRGTDALVKRFDARAWVRKTGLETTSRHGSTTSRANP